MTETGTHPDAGRRDQRGAVTAELALGLPLLLGVTVVMVWLLALAAGQVRAVDGARETARALARGDDPAEALAVGRRVAPAGARFAVARGGGRVVVRVTAEVAGPGGLGGVLPDVTLAAEAVAVQEQGAGPPGGGRPPPAPRVVP